MKLSSSRDENGDDINREIGLGRKRNLILSAIAMVNSARTFRIFVSSTFDDLKAERNALQQHVFPKLRELCQQHGCRFQAFDLRWGVRDEAALDQQRMNSRLEGLPRPENASASELR